MEALQKLLGDTAGFAAHPIKTALSIGQADGDAATHFDLADCTIQAGDPLTAFAFAASQKLRELDVVYRAPNPFPRRR